MQPLQLTGRTFYAIGLTCLGCLCIINKDFIIGRPPATNWATSLNPLLGYVGGVLVIVAAIFIIAGKKVRPAALSIGILILLFSLPRHLSQFETDWLNGFKAMALLGGSLIVSQTSTSDRNNHIQNYLVTAGCILVASFFIAGGYAHFKFAVFVKEFIPGYIPFRLFFAYFCGVCLIAGGIGILIPYTRRLAALLSGIMLTGWFLLLHIPRFINDTKNVSDRMGLCESLAFAGVMICLTVIASKKSGVRSPKSGIGN